MLMRKGIGAVFAAGAMATLIGLAGCADTGQAGTGYASGYGSGYDTLGYDADGVWLGGLYGGGYGWWGGYNHDRHHGHGRDGVAGNGRVGGAVSHGGLGGGVMHASAGSFGGGHFGGGFGGGGHGGGGGHR